MRISIGIVAFAADIVTLPAALVLTLLTCA
jgi:hypothetical protein